MSQRGSGYERKERDRYITPAWVTRGARASSAQAGLHLGAGLRHRLDGKGARGISAGRDRNEIVTRPTLN